jgi:amino acid adenylation domain-containing protein
MFEHASSISGMLEFWTERHDRASMRQLADQLVRLVRGLVDEPDVPVATVEHRSADEVAALWAQGRARADIAAPVEAHVHEQFAGWVARTPNATAVVDGAATYSYAQLDAWAAEIARSLAAAGCGVGDRVAVACGRCAGSVASMLAVLRLGAAYVPVDTSAPRQWLGRLLSLAEVKAAICIDDAAADALRAADAQCPVLELDAPAGAGLGAAAHGTLPEARLAPPGVHPAYVMFTSGSTGVPKGVEVVHAGITSLAASPAYVEVTAQDVVLALAPLEFDASTFELWAALLNGATLVMAPAGPLALEELAGIVQRHRVSVLHLTAGLMRAVIDERVETLDGVRELLTGGDVVSAPHVARALDRFPDLRVTACYGPTEVTTFASVHVVERGSTVERTPIGAPIPGRTMHVMDPHQRPASPGVLGEVVVGGVGLATGYLADPAATAAAFVPAVDPQAPPGARAYRTGDRGWVRVDGVFEFAERADDQVKVRGFRIDPAEVCAALGQHPQVRQAFVATEGDAADKHLVAYCEPSGGAAMDEQQLRSHARAVLPGHMVPSRFVVVDRLPISVNGKVDRAALARHRRQPVRDEAGAHHAWTAAQQPFVEIWCELLGAEHASPHDSFFDVGGNSLLATRLVARVSARLRCELPLRVLFDIPNLGDLVAWFEQAEAQPAAASGAAGGPIPVAGGEVGALSMDEGLLAMTDEERSALGLAARPATEAQP